MIILIVLAVIALIGILIYNSLVSKRNQTENAFATIDTLLKKRYDLIPNMVATVKEYASHELETFTKITEIRTTPYNQMSEAGKVDFDKKFTSGVRNFIALRENYPQLKASDNFLHLQRTLNETEEQLSAARRTFNAAVTEYNNAVETFPNNLFAKTFGFTRKAVFEIPQEERVNPDVKNLFRS